jgi:hypothetical protein
MHWHETFVKDRRSMTNLRAMMMMRLNVRMRIRSMISPAAGASPG